MAGTHSDDESPVLPRPKKNFALFSINEAIGFFPKQIFKGEMGKLPIFMAVNVGYDPEDPDPFMYPYESQEVLFAYRKDVQRRVLLQDSYQRTLSLPLQSTLITFHVGEDDTEELTVSEILDRRSPPVKLRFAHPLNLDFQVEKVHRDHAYFGDLVLTQAYEEPFYWCLGIQGCGKVMEKPRVLPRNLKDVCFAPIISVRGAADPTAKVKEFIDKFTQDARQVDFPGDPFFQELAIVSQGPAPVENVEPYIEQNTFVPIRHKRRPAPEAPPEEAPGLPPRNLPSPHSSKSREADGSEMKTTKSHAGSEAAPYSGLIYSGDDNEHVYNVPGEPDGELGDKAASPTRLQMVKPLRAPEGGSPTEKHGDRSHRRSPRLGQSSHGGSDDGKPHSHRTCMMAPPLPPRSVKEFIDALSINDVSVKLKELGLEKYAKKFRKKRIDGVLLQKLTEDTLKAEFNMTPVEFLLLDSFIKDGHIPKHSRRKCSSPFPFL